jgi:surfeit locus 1 family protein
MLSRLKGKGLLMPTLAMLVGVCVLTALGVWQWQRKAWKEELIATIASRSSAPPLPARLWATLNCRPMHEVGLAKSCDFLPVRLAGQFDHAAERHVFANVPRSGGDRGGPGYWVMTPFDLADGTGARVFVNRGFVPEAMKNPQTRSAGQIEGEVEIIGQIRSAEQRSLFSGRSNPAANVWFLRDPRELLADSDSPDRAAWTGPGPAGLDFYVDLIMPKPPGGYPAPRPSRIEIANRHLEYALTWWGLALTLIGVYVAFAFGRLRARALADA